LKFLFNFLFIEKSAKMYHGFYKNIKIKQLRNVSWPPNQHSSHWELE